MKYWVSLVNTEEVEQFVDIAKKAEELVKIKRYDYGPEFGIGFNFFFNSFIFSPEIKITNGLNNIHARDENLRFSSVFDRIRSKMIVFSIHLEG